MSLWDTIKGWFGGGVAEAHSLNIDDDDHLYRPLTGRATSDLPQYQHDKMLNVALHLYRGNLVAKRILELITDFVFAEGVQIKTRNSEVEKVIREHWDDAVNQWDDRGPRLFRTLLRDGEVVMTSGVNPVDGRVRWGTIPSRVVEKVVPDPLNWEIVRTVILKRDSESHEERRLPVINENPETGRLEGECVFLKTNDDGLRGISFLYALADFLDALNTMAYSEVERAQLLRAFMWDVTIEGAEREELEQFAREAAYQTPQPGARRVHNEKVTWQALAPQLNSYDAANLMTWILNLILGASGIPEHWFGSGGDVNRAVGAVMDTPTIKMLSRFQREWQAVMVLVLRYVIDQAVASGRLDAQVPVENAEGEQTGEMIEARMAFEVVLPDMDTTDMAQLASTVVQVVQALVIAEEQGYITNETAMGIFVAVASQIGPDIDPDLEADKLKKQREEREKEGEVPTQVATAIQQLMAQHQRDDGEKVA